VLLLSSLSAFLMEGHHFALIAPLVLIYSLLYVCLQLAYNIPGAQNYVNADPAWMLVTGFRQFEYPSLALSLGLILCCWTALYVQTSRQIGAAAATSNLEGLTSMGANGSEKKTTTWIRFKLFLSFIFANAFWITLLGAYVYAISNITVINTGYLLLSLFFFCFPKLAPKGWIVFVIYSQLVIIVLFCWQFVPSDQVLPEWSAKETGLLLFQVPWRTMDIPGPWSDPYVVQTQSTWQNVLGMPVFILLFSLIQYTIFNNVNVNLREQALMEGLKTPRALDDAVGREMPTAYRFITTIGLVLEEMCGVLAFASLLLLVTVQPPNAINFGYLVLIFLLCVTYTPSGHGRRNIFKFVSSGVLLYTALVLFTQYVMEFPRWNAKGFERDVWKWTGFVRVEYSRILLFLPTTLALLMPLYYVKILDKEENISETDKEEAAERLQSEAPMLQVLTDFLKRFAILHMGKVFVLWLFVVALIHPNAFGLVLLVYAIIDLFFLSRGGLPRWPLMFLAFAYLSAEYGYQISLNGNYKPLQPTANDKDMLKWAAWAGFARWDDATLGIQPCLWTCILGAVSSSAISYWSLELPEEGKSLNAAEPCVMFLRHTDSRGLPFQKVKEHFNDAFSKHGILITLTMMVTAACARTNAMSFVYLLIASLSLMISHESLARHITLWSGIFIALAAYFLLEYMVLWNPLLHPWQEGVQDTDGSDEGDRFIVWAESIPYKSFFSVTIEDKWLLLVDVGALFFAALQARSAWLPMPGPSPLEFAEKDMETGDLVDRMLVGAIRIFICNYSPTFVTVAIAVAGGMEVTMVDYVYLIIALMFLSYGTMLMRTRNPWWQFLRCYNVLLMVLGCLANSPFSSSDTNKLSIQTNSGIWASLVPQIIIFFLLALQSDIFGWDQYEKALGYLTVLKMQGKFREMERSELEKKKLASSVLTFLEERIERRNALFSLDQDIDKSEDLVEKESLRASTMDQQDEVVEAEPEVPNATIAETGTPIPWVRNMQAQMRGSVLSLYSWNPQLIGLTERELCVYPDDGYSLTPQDFERGQPRDYTPTHCITVADIIEVKVSDAKGPAVWKVVTKKTKLYFQAASPLEAEEWVNDVMLYRDVAEGKLESPKLEDAEELEDEDCVKVWWQEYVGDYLPKATIAAAEYLESKDEYKNVELTVVPNDTGATDMDAVTKGKDNPALRFGVALQGVMMSHTGGFCYALLVLNHAVNGGVVTMILPALSFLWAIIHRPRPPQWIWHFIILYTLALVSLQYVIKLPAFCDEKYKYGIQGHCEGLTEITSMYLSEPYVVGVRPGDDFLSIAWVDIAILVAVGVHIKRLQYTGRWDDGKGGSDNRAGQVGDEAASFISEVHVELPPGVTMEEYHAAEKGLLCEDHYANMFFADVVVLLYTFFFYSDMSNSVQTIQDSLNSNSLDWGFVSILMTQFLVLVLDRIAYLTKSNSLKWWLQVLQVIGYHVCFLLIVQMQSGNISIAVLYVLKCNYFGLSAVQIRCGYPMYTQGEYLTRVAEGKEPTTSQYYMYVIYRSVPFLFELRGLLDWSCSRTALDFYQWFKLEDIHGQLFQTRCYIQQRKDSHKFGEERSTCNKISVGLTTFVALCMLLWLPLVLFSNGSALMVPNPVTAASMHVSLSDGFRNYRLYSVDSGLARELKKADINVMERAKIIEPYFDKTGTQIVRFPKTSDTIFTAPPPLVNDMIARLLNPNRTVSFHVQTVWERDLPLSNKETAFSSSVTLNLEKKTELANVMSTVLDSQKSIQASFTIDALLPDVLHVPARSPVSQLGYYSHNLLFTFYHVRDGHSWDQWWDIQYVDPGHAPKPIEVFVVSSQVLGSYMGLGSYISQLGVVGCYISVVFVIGQLLRGFVSNLQARVMYEDMEDVSVPMYLCKCVYLARQEAGSDLDGLGFSGHGGENVLKGLKLEEHLYWELIRLYRQPDKLYGYTTVHAVAPDADTPLLPDN